MARRVFNAVALLVLLACLIALQFPMMPMPPRPPHDALARYTLPPVVVLCVLLGALYWVNPGLAFWPRWYGELTLAAWRTAFPRLTEQNLHKLLALGWWFFGLIAAAVAAAHWLL